MKAVVFHGVGEIRLDNVPEPGIEAATDAVVRLTAGAICGTDLHRVRGTMAGMVPGTILGHEGVGIIEEVGPAVLDFKVGDRVVVPSTTCCGHCSPCTAGCQSQCDNANPNGRSAGSAFFGGPKPTGPFHGLQAEWARVPLADSTLVKLPDGLSDDQAILLSDSFPTGYYGADVAGTKPGDAVCVFGCGPVGLFAIVSAKMLGTGRVFAVNTLPDQLAKARELGAETRRARLPTSHAGYDRLISERRGSVGRSLAPHLIEAVSEAEGRVIVDAARPLSAGGGSFSRGSGEG